MAMAIPARADLPIFSLKNIRAKTELSTMLPPVTNGYNTTAGTVFITENGRAHINIIIPAIWGKETISSRKNNPQPPLLNFMLQVTNVMIILYHKFLFVSIVFKKSR